MLSIGTGSSSTVSLNDQVPSSWLVYSTSPDTVPLVIFMVSILSRPAELQLAFPPWSQHEDRPQSCWRAPGSFWLHLVPARREHPSGQLHDRADPMGGVRWDSSGSGNRAIVRGAETEVIRKFSTVRRAVVEIRDSEAVLRNKGLFARGQAGERERTTQEPQPWRQA